MIYEFYCEKCRLGYDIHRSAADASEPAWCVACDGEMRRLYSPPHIIGASVFEPEFNPAFGKVIRSKNEAKELARRYDLTEVGNEKPETIHKHFDKQREQKMKEDWNKL